MASAVCADASLLLALLIPEEHSARASALWRSWLREGVAVFVPALLFSEVTSALRLGVTRRRLTPAEGELAFDSFRRLRVHSLQGAELQPRAWDLAKAYGQARAYDAQYLAVARAIGCDLWTLDERLVNSVGEAWVRFAGRFVGE